MFIGGRLIKSGKSLYTRSMEHIIKHTVNWREEDYDGYNDYFVNPDFLPKQKYNNSSKEQEEEDK